MPGTSMLHRVHRGGAAAAIGACTSLRSTLRSKVSKVRYQSQRASKEKTCLAEEAIHMLKEPAPAAFRTALIEGFRKEVHSFNPEVHQGDRQQLLQRLRRCRLGRKATAFNLEVNQAQQVTQAYIQALWSLAAARGLAVNSKGNKMRSAAADLARAFLEGQESQSQEGPSDPPSGAWKAIGSWLKEGAQERLIESGMQAEDFDDAVLPFWRHQLARVTRPEALRLVPQLGGDNRFGWLRSMAGHKPTALFAQALQWKSQTPHCVLLVQVGDFFEAWGIDAVMLVQWCGLNPMARRARAGFPVNAASLQQTVDCLTRAEVSVAVYVQSAENKTMRVLRQVLTPGAPTYLHGNELGKEAIGEFSEGRPYIAMRLRTDGLLFAEIRPFRREVRFREDVTPEAVEALLADQDGVAWPIFVDGSRRSFQQVNKWKWFPKQRRWLNLPSEVRDDYFLNRCCQELCQTLQLAQEPPFVHVRLNTAGALQPLTLSTAKNLGVLKQDGVPFLVAHALSPEAPASARRLLRRWLLAPRSQESVHAMRQMLRAFSSDQALVLPSLHRVPPVAKVIAYITARTGSERLFRDVMDCVAGLKTLLEKQRYKDLWNPLLKIVASETGLEQLPRDEFLADLDDILQLLQKWLHDTSQSDDPLADCHVSEDAETQRAVDRLFESNEAFRGVASQQQELVADAYQSLKSARHELCEALREGLPPDQPGVLVYNPFDNDICFKKKPLVDSHGAHDRRGKVKKERFTTKRLEAALATYLACAKRTEAATQQALQQLCSELGGQVPALRSAVCGAELLLTAHCHASHALRSGWSLPQIGGELLDATLAPYWMEPGDAVFSHVQLSKRGAIATGPNMSGKSTLMRALGACALLANCGFLCPCKAKAVVPHYSQVVWVSAEGDRPAEGISAFGYEAMISATLLRRATEGTLALVDEFGRGTEPRAAKAAVCTLIEELSERRTQFVVATHLHDVVDMKLRTGAQPVAWRMGIKGSGSQFGNWTYQLELGVCRDSLAAQTLSHFGWPKMALERFHALLEEPPEGRKTDGSNDYTLALNEAKENPIEPMDEGLEVEDAGEAVMAMMSSFGAAEILRLSPRDVPPAPLCAGASILYTLILRGQVLYIGQSDNLRQRLQQHRQRFGERLEAVLLMPVENTSTARRLETQLQRDCLRRGMALESNADALHRNFPIKDDMKASGPAASLRRMAQELNEMAERLEAMEPWDFD